MYRLIVADDEPIIRDGLVNGVDWEALGFMVTASFSCGSDITAYLENNPADVLLSDIVMNQGTGLDAAEWISLHRPRMQVVLFTGYSDFSMACQAVSCRSVKHLITKPTQPDELRRIFMSIAEKLGTHEGEFGGDYTRSLVCDIFRLIERGLDGTGDTGCVTLCVKGTFPSLAVPEFRAGDAATPGFRVELADETMLVWPCAPEWCPHVLESTRIWADLALPRIEACIRSYNDVGAMFADIYPGSESMLSAVDRTTAAGTYTELPGIFRNALSQDVGWNTLITMAEKADIAISARLQQEGLEVDGNVHRELVAMASGPSEPDRLISWAGKIANLAEQASLRREDRLIQAVNTYLDEHLQEGVTLADTARKVYFSAGYLSRLFKKKTGDSFTNYVIQYKIERAKSFLLKPGITVNQAGEMVGYRDKRHFSRMFKRYTGQTPSEYRRNAVLGGATFNAKL